MKVSLLSLLVVLMVTVVSSSGSHHEGGEEGFRRWSFLKPTADINGVSSIVHSGGEGDDVAFVHDHELYTANGFKEGTKDWSDRVYQDKLVSFHHQGLHYVFYSTGGELKYFDPATGESTLVHSWISKEDQTIYFGTPLFATRTKVYAMWHVPGFFQFYSFEPETHLFKVESSVPDRHPVAADDVVVLPSRNNNNERLVSRYDLVGSSLSEHLKSTVVGIPLGHLPSRLFYSETLDAIFFSYNSQGLGNELWRTSNSGNDLNKIEIVADINTGAADSNPGFYCDVPGVGLFFFATATSSGSDPNQLSLFVMDASFTVKHVFDFDVKFSSKIPIVRVGHRAVFILELVDRDHEGDVMMMWSSDGTTEGTKKLMSINNEHQWHELTSVGDLAFTVSDTDEFGWELYQTDGTPDGTIKTPYETIEGPGSSDPKGLVAINGDLFFNANTPEDGVQLFKYSPDRVPSRTMVIFDAEEEWVEAGGVQSTWGSNGVCEEDTQQAPTNFPLFSSTEPIDFDHERVISIQKKSSEAFGCGHFFPTFLDVTGAKELRFWISSTVDVKVEMEMDQPCKPFRPIAGQHPCKPFVKVPSTNGDWQSYGISLSDRPEHEFQSVYSPLLVTALGSNEGRVYITNVVYVY